MDSKVGKVASGVTPEAHLADRIQRGERGIMMPLGTACAVANELRKRGEKVVRC